MPRKKIHVKGYDRNPPTKRDKTRWPEEAAKKIDKALGISKK